VSNTSRRHFLEASALLPAIAAGSAQARSAPAGAPDILGSAQWERPAKQKGNNLNLLLFVSDTFRADNLAVYGSEFVDAPNLNKLAGQSVVFKDAYAEGLPTIPVRRALYTGRRVAPMYTVPQIGENLGGAKGSPGWHHLYHEDITLSEVLIEAGYATALIADLPHLQRPGRNFHRGYRYYEWIRGQETDWYAQPPRVKPSFADIYPPEVLQQIEAQRAQSSPYADSLNQYVANRKRWLKEADSIIEQTARKTIAWLKENHDQGPFFLHVESFDPHEPWDPPVNFLAKYIKNVSGPSWAFPARIKDKLPPEAVARLRANYAGEASNVDYWFGKIVDTLSELGLADNTVVAFTADHGTILGEQDQFGKGAERQRNQVTHLPLIVRAPGQTPAKVSGFAQHPDITPTLLGRLGLEPPKRATGEDLWPYVTGARNNKREHIVGQFGWVGSVRTAEWAYQASLDESKTNGFRPQLYDLKRDPHELHDVAEQNANVIRALDPLLRAYIDNGWETTRGSFAGRV
jgi:arylsulfatase A-like enzyme